ncbi:MAG: MgtC/SapB family protein [Proteobacteria bacterium]|nr:MgtC/SapB family protein [Pseudomonadota bacterium]
MSELSQLVPDPSQLIRVSIRLLAALAVGTAIGLQRELTHKTAGLRTHMLISLGTALFVVGAAESGMPTESLARVIQGIAAGIGFLGGGAILKLTDKQEVHGMTTAAGVWMTAAASAVAALGQIWVAILSTLFALLVLTVFRRLEKDLGLHGRADGENHRAPTSGSQREDDE